MTSGHGQQGDSDRQPPQWQQPGPPRYGQPGPPPYGQPGPPPYGPPGPPPWGTSTAPGFGQPPPEAKERPLSVRAGLGAFVVSIVLNLAGSVFALANWDEYVGQTLAQEPRFQDPQLQTA